MLGITFSEIEFADGNKISMKPGDILVVTGPNGGGKTNVLRNLHGATLQRETNQGKESIKSTKTVRTGNEDQLIKLLEIINTVTDQGSDHLVTMPNSGTYAITKNSWLTGDLSGNLLPFFSNFLTAREKFNAIATQQLVSYPFAQHPVQKLYYLLTVEEDIGAITKGLFDIDICCHLDGTQLQMRTGNRDNFVTKSDYRTKIAHSKGRDLPALPNEGDGVQSFAGILLSTLVEPTSITLIDEPEAFLHPPQARRLAGILAERTKKQGQLIVATHDYDFIRGLISSGGERVHVIRVSRTENRTKTKHLPSNMLKELWSDPILYTSDLLSAIFHDIAVICEGDSDVRFFRALLDAIEPTLRKPVPDIRFFSCGSKAKIDKVAMALTAVGVPTLAIADCDILNSKDLIPRIVRSLAKSMSSFERSYDVLSAAVNKNYKPKSTSAAIGELQTLIEQLNAQDFEKKKQPLSSRIRNELKTISEEDSQWRDMKHRGRGAIVPLGVDATKEFDDICKKCEENGLFINTTGELESFWPEGPRNNKSEWLAKVLEKPLATDPNLTLAREFLTKIVELARASSV